MNHAKCYIQHYPRPQLVRGDWLDLNGRWDFAFDAGNEGEDRKYFQGFEKQYDITVPFTYECSASGIGREEACGNVWYQRSIKLDKAQLAKRCLLNFDGVDYTAKVWVNGFFAGTHSGGYVRFSLDVTNYVREGDNLIVVKAEDGDDIAQPRGKQRWMPYNYGCWYVQTTGIWKSVWMEFTNRKGQINSVKITPRIEEYSFDVELDAKLAGAEGYELFTEVEFRGRRVTSVRSALNGEVLKQKLFIESGLIDNQVYFWSPGDPSVYDFTFTLFKDGEEVDRIGSYCGFRDFRTEGNKVVLNGAPFYQKLVLYQGYWKDTGITPPNEDAVVRDIELIKEAGFNGARLHQIVETDEFLYYADIMGLLVWCELPSPHTFNERANTRVLSEWREILRQTYNHTAIVTWVIYNESWGIREVTYNKVQQMFTESLYFMTKAYDCMRPVIANDGWEHTLCDVFTIHDYEQDAQVFEAVYHDVNDLQCKHRIMPPHMPFANGYRYGGQPVIFSEYGGCAFSDDVKAGWGYGEAVRGADAFYIRFGALLRSIKSFGYCSGYCYTQFTDVQQEKNGLFTIERICKVDIGRIRAMNEE